MSIVCANKCLEIHGSAVFWVVLGDPILKRFSVVVALLVEEDRMIKASTAH